MTLFLFLFFIILILAVFWHWPRFGLYLAIFFAPFLGLVLDFSHFQWAQNLPYLKNIDAPLADFVVLGLFGAVGVKMVWGWICRGGPVWPPPSNRATTRGCPYNLGYWLPGVGFFYFLPFLLTGFLSLWNVPYDQFNGSLKYLLRPILFFYLMWVVLPVLLIDSEKILDRVIKILFWTGALSALMGLISLFINPAIFGFWQRASPIEFWGLTPLAYNHNLLAEVLVAAAPLAFYLFIVETNGRSSLQHVQTNGRSSLHFLGFILIVAIALLTFARAAWLALFVELIIYFLLTGGYRRFVPKATRGTLREAEGGVPRSSEARNGNPLKGLIVLSSVILPLLIYMLLFSLSPLVRSSNATRLDLTGISWTYFKLHPWLGNGVGTFIPLVEQTRLFTVEYGDPLDAHGVLQKLAAEQGLLGLITFVIFISWIIHRLYGAFRLADKKYQLLLLCLFLSVVGSLVYQLFNTSYYNAHLWLPVGVALAAVRVKGLGYRV